MNLSRKEFIKFTSLLPLLLGPKLIYQPAANLEDPPDFNILIVLFDAFSAKNIPFYGYPRNTTPNLNHFLDRATVYHNHYAAGSFTTPGTASLMTGVYPWEHRAGYIWERVLPQFVDKSFFALLDKFHRITYTHNPVADVHLETFINDINIHKPVQELYLNTKSSLVDRFEKDYDAFSTSWVRTVVGDEGYANSLFISRLNQLKQMAFQYQFADLGAQFPRGLPFVTRNHFFILEDAINWSMNIIENSSDPFLAYFHYFPPHSPYDTRVEFIDQFKEDGYRPTEKPLHFFGRADKHTESKLKLRQRYDEYILYVDAEFKRLLNHLETTGLDQNTWIIFTSDHGDLFERGFLEHPPFTLHEPVIRIPLLISRPGQTEREDIFTPTSAVDVLPTLMHLTGQEVPDWCAGMILPPFNPQPLPEDRSIFAFDSRINQNQPLSKGTGTIIKNGFKLTYYYGYKKLKDQEMIELFDLREDPEELTNLSNQHPQMVSALLDELKSQLAQAAPGRTAI
ncbi:sulfatase [Chloroflexota bacterium]